MRAADVMTRHVLTVTPQTLVADAVKMMIDNRISGLPVIGADQQVVGIVSEGDFLRRAEIGTEIRRCRWLEIQLGPRRLAAEYVYTHARKIDEVMTDKVVTANEDASLADLVRLMERHQIKRVPILRDGRLVGIVSRANLLQALAIALAEAPATAPADAVVRDLILAEIDRQPWGPGASISVIVKDGTVDLVGTIFHERERLALRVAAENTRGVKAVRDNLICIDPTVGFLVTPSLTPAAP